MKPTKELIVMMFHSGWRCAGLVLLAFLVGTPGAVSSPRSDPASVEQSENASALPENMLREAQRVADHYIRTQSPELYYADLLTLYGIVRLAEISDGEDYGRYADGHLQRFFEQGPTSPITFRNYEMGGLAGMYRLRQGRGLVDHAVLRGYVDELVGEHPRDEIGVFAHPREPGGRIWVDCLMAVCPFLSMAAVVLDEPELHDASIRQYEGMAQQLFNEKLGLFHQSKNFGDPGCRTTDTWGRGNGWALIGLVEILKYLPADHPRRASLIGSLRTMAVALKPLQAPSGMWRQNLVTESSYEETSGTGLIVYALAMGVRKGWLSEEFLPVVRSGWRGIIGQIEEDGAVQNTCVGTLGKCDDTLDYYLKRPVKTDDPHAFGPVLLAAVECHLLFSTIP